MENSKIAELYRELCAPGRDLSDLLAQIDICCLLLEVHEPGLWWDKSAARRRLSHPAIAHWLRAYQYAQLGDLPSAALLAFATSLQRRVDSLQAGAIEGKIEP